MPVERHEGIDSVAADWDELADRVGAPPWLRPGWISTWVGAFGGTARLEVLAEHASSGLVAGILPMLRSRGALVSPTNSHTPEFGLLAETPDASAAVAAATVADRPRHVTLGWVAPDALDVMRVAANRAGYRVLDRSLMRSPYIAFDAAPSADGYSSDNSTSPRTSTVRSHKVRELRRRLRKLEKLGHLDLDVERTTDHLLDGFAIEGSGWKEKEGSAIVSHHETRAFYEEISRWAGQRGTLRLFFLRLDDRPIAFALCLEDNARLYYVKGGFDVEFRSLGPGVIMTHSMIDYAEEHGLRSFEFLGGEEAWKLEWTRDVRDRRLFQAFAPAPVALAEWTLYAYGRPLAKRLLRRIQH